MARQCFDRVIGLRGGRIVLDSPSHQLSDQQLAEVYRS
jgi:ABC-type phosphate/phosphonate transport system ATPase subunit